MTIVLQDRLTDSILKIVQNSTEPLETEEILRLVRKQWRNSTRTKIMYRLSNLRADGLVSGKMLGAGKGVWIWWSSSKLRSSADDENAWPEEVQALENIKSGRTNMITQSADETLTELKELENES
ncbi:MAG: hypothetical protein GEU26_01715 [Nitrososphaeraceae archaeon]|nr:hypothetical protein [Nitrososphaeraceae archaeon]